MLFSSALRVLVVAALTCSVFAQVTTYGPCLCKCAIGSSSAPGIITRCIDNQDPTRTQDCGTSCNPFATECQTKLPNSAVFGLPAASSATDVTCAGGGSAAFPYSLTLWPITTPSSGCVTRSPTDASVFVSPAPVGSPLFSVGPCLPLTISSVQYGVQLLGVSFSKNFVALIYSSASCAFGSYLTSISGQARADCPDGQVYPSNAPTVVSGSNVYFAAKVPAQTSSSNIACTCKCAQPNSVVGQILGCTDLPAAQCGGAYCASRYPGQCITPNYYLATPPQDAIASQGIPCAGVNGYLLTAKTYRYPAMCPNPSSTYQFGSTVQWNANQCVSSYDGYSQRFLGCSSSNYYLFQSFVGSNCDPARFISVTGGQAGCSFNTWPYGYTLVYTCSSPAQQLAAGIIVAIVIGAILVFGGGLWFCRFMRRRQDVMLMYKSSY